MKVQTSKFLIEHKDALKRLVSILSLDFAYVSVLGTDTCGKRYMVQKTGVSIGDSMWSERGFVVRVYNGINYSELSFNEISKDNVESLAGEIHSKILNSINKIKGSSINVNRYPIIEEDDFKESFIGEVNIMLGKTADGEVVEKLTNIKDEAFKCSKYIVDFKVIFECVHVSKLFISSKKELEQSYVWSQGYLWSILRRENSKFYFRTFSGLKGIEMIDEMLPMVKNVVDTNEKLLDAKAVKPGEYDVICTPEITGLLAHEAFGHGVEMDMFVKERAKAIEYIGKPVASKFVNMHDGARAANEVSSYYFDDEGTLGTDTMIIENGILKTGISDLLSALKLGTTPTGNGKRESFERKAYTRMTNTFFSPGNDKLEDMIASIKYGYLLDGELSGMEDPKNWGIQCVFLAGHEIIDGKLTGKIVSPVIMTGYVPDLLMCITMVSDDIKMFGSGACGKGYKEYVKVSDGGPYIKTKGRLV